MSVNLFDSKLFTSVPRMLENCMEMIFHFIDAKCHKNDAETEAQAEVVRSSWMSFCRWCDAFTKIVNQSNWNWNKSWKKNTHTHKRARRDSYNVQNVRSVSHFSPLLCKQLNEMHEMVFALVDPKSQTLGCLFASILSIAINLNQMKPESKRLCTRNTEIEVSKLHLNMDLELSVWKTTI